MQNIYHNSIQKGHQAIFLILMLTIAYSVSFFLLSLDKDVRSYDDLLGWKAMLVISYYALPSFIVSMLLFSWFNHHYNKIVSLILSIGIGLPMGIILVIGFFHWIM